MLSNDRDRNAHACLRLLKYLLHHGRRVVALVWIERKRYIFCNDTLLRVLWLTRENRLHTSWRLPPSVELLADPDHVSNLLSLLSHNNADIAKGGSTLSTDSSLHRLLLRNGGGGVIFFLQLTILLVGLMESSLTLFRNALTEEGRDCEFFTMMRNPIDRAVSAFFYCPMDHDIQAMRPAEVYSNSKYCMSGLPPVGGSYGCTRPIETNYHTWPR